MTSVQVTKVNVKNLQEQKMQQVFYTYGLDEHELDKGKGVYGLVYEDGMLEDVKYYGNVDEVYVRYEEDESNDFRYIEMADMCEKVEVSYEETYGIDLIRI